MSSLSSARSSSLLAPRQNQFTTQPVKKNALAVVEEPKPLEQTVQKITGLVVSTAPMPPAAAISNDLLQEHMAAGVLSPEKGEELRLKIAERCEKVLAAYDESHRGIRDAIQEFKADFTEQNKEVGKLILGMLKGLSTNPGEKPPTENAKFVFEATKTGNSLRSDFIKNLIDLEKSNLDLLEKGSKSMLQLSLDSRKAEIDNLKQMISLVQSQENHAQAIAVAYHMQQLKAEGQAFDQLLAFAKLQNEANAQERDLDLKEQKQKDARDAAFAQLEMQEDEAIRQHRLDSIRLENEHEDKANAHELEVRKETDRTELNKASIKIAENREDNLVEQYAQEYRLKMAQLEGQVDVELRKVEGKEVQIKSEERRMLAQLRSEEIMRELGIRSVAELKSLDHEQVVKLKRMEKEGRCAII